MFPWVAGVLIGAWVAGRNRPHTHVEKRQLLGTRSGMVYEADDLFEAGLVVVKAPNVTAVFVRTPKGLKYFRGSGPPPLLARLVQDILGAPINGIRHGSHPEKNDPNQP